MSVFYIVFMSLQLSLPFCSIQTELFYVLTSNVFATTNSIHCYAFLILHIYECSDNYDKSIHSPSLNGLDPWLTIECHRGCRAPGRSNSWRISGFRDQEGVDVQGFGE